ncbi:MAG: pentapeptide repeat-containing protein [Sandaracinaceae bacterium]|nr:pentapeptide repeat-containing protein [Sandaracinaceae bacterium]
MAARCFTYRDEEARDLSEVPLALRTLWLVPDEDMIVLVFHGSEEVSSMLASEVRGVLCALDDPDRPRDLEHFGRALARRLDRELGGAEMLDDGPLMPEGMRFPDFQARAEDLTLPERRGALEANLRAGAELRRQEALRLFSEAGFEGGEELFPPQAPPAPSKAPLTEQIREAFAEAERQRAAAEEKTAAMRAEAMAELEELGLDPALFERPHVGPPPILAAQHLAMLEEVVRDARAAGVPMEAFERQLEDPDFHRELLEKEVMGREAYRLSAHHTEGAPEVDLDRRDAVRAFVEAAIRERASLARADLTAADLAELDLSGMDLTGAWLEGANLQKANLSHARLDSAVLAKADLSEAVLSGTSLRRASLGKARLLWTAVDRCDLEEAILASADLRGARFSRSSLAGADLSDVRLERTSFAECDLGAVTFLRMSLADTVFSACKLEECNFVEVCLDRTSLTRCRLAKSVFVTCTGEGTALYEADLENARFVSGCVFEDCDFRRARMPRSTLRGGRFARSFFDEADLSESDVSQGVFSEARFYRADLRRALATECDLREAMMAGANLMLAVLQGSDIRGADLRGTNLFGADLALVHADRATSLEGALVKLGAAPAAPEGGVVITRAELEARVRRGEPVRKESLAGLDLTGAALAGAVFERVDLRGASLGGADLAESIFDGCDLSGARLPAARLERSVWSKCTFEDVSADGVGGPRQLRGVPLLARHARALGSSARELRAGAARAGRSARLRSHEDELRGLLRDHRGPLRRHAGGDRLRAGRPARLELPRDRGAKDRLREVRARPAGLLRADPRARAAPRVRPRRRALRRRAPRDLRLPRLEPGGRLAPPRDRAELPLRGGDPRPRRAARGAAHTVGLLPRAARRGGPRRRPRGSVRVPRGRGERRALPRRRPHLRGLLRRAPRRRRLLRRDPAAHQAPRGGRSRGRSAPRAAALGDDPDLLEAERWRPSI